MKKQANSALRFPGSGKDVEYRIHSDGKDVFVVEARDGIQRRIAKRRLKDTSEAGTWDSIVPGCKVSGTDEIVIEYERETRH